MLGQLLEPFQKEHSPTESGFYILNSGRQAFLERAALIEAAQKTIDVQYYIWNPDSSGNYLAFRLLLAAERGVKVRILLDDFNLNENVNRLALLDSHPNITVRIYNPSFARKGLLKWLGFLKEFSRLNRRMHNKIFVVDGVFGIVGGRNIGDEYFDMSEAHNLRDRDIFAAGTIVKNIAANFDAYWNSSWSYPVKSLIEDTFDDSNPGNELQALLKQSDGSEMLQYCPPEGSQQGRERLHLILKQMTWAEAELIYDNPVPADINDLDAYSITAKSISRKIGDSQKEVLIESAYCVLSDEQLKSIRDLTSRDVAVKILTNSMAANDLVTNHAGYARTRKAMLQSGIKLYEFRPDARTFREELKINIHSEIKENDVALHSKSIVFDRKTLYIGSFNANLRSAYLNFETVLIVHSPKLAQEVAIDIETYFQPGNTWVAWLKDNRKLAWGDQYGVELYNHEPETSFLERCQSVLFRLFPLEKYY